MRRKPQHLRIRKPHAHEKQKIKGIDQPPGLRKNSNHNSDDGDKLKQEDMDGVDEKKCFFEFFAFIAAKGLAFDLDVVLKKSQTIDKTHQGHKSENHVNRNPCLCGTWLSDKVLHPPKRKHRRLKEDSKKKNLGCFERALGQCVFHKNMVSRPVMNVHQIPARKDNYIYILEDQRLDHCVVIDATDFEKIDAFCVEKKKALSAILVTHHHEDHINSILKLTQKYQSLVYGFQKDAYRIPGLTDFVKDGDTVSYGSHSLHVFETPGHTLGHISYFLSPQKYLFCGDVMFRFGCGRLIEGSAKMMLETLQMLRALPEETLVYCSHEYTLDNLAFCVNLEPENSALSQRYDELKNLRKQNRPTVPFPLKEQKELSAFLRWEDPVLKKALGAPNASDLETFTEVRKRRNLPLYKQQYN